MKLKITYFLTLIIACALYALLALETLALLNSHLDPALVVVRYNGYHALLFLTTVFFYILLMVFSNILYIKELKSFFFLISAIVFIAFTLYFHIHITEAYYSFKQEVGLWSGGFYSGYIYGFFYSLIAVIITTGNYLLLLFFVKPRIRSGYFQW